MKILYKIIFMLIFTFLSLFIMFYFLHPIFFANSLIIPYAIFPFDICIRAPTVWKSIKIMYLTVFIFSCLLFSNSIFTIFFKRKITKQSHKKIFKINNSQNALALYVGTNFKNENIFISEYGLYQNILITGTIGSGKTSSAIYPFTSQLMNYKSESNAEKLGMLILDVKGNFYKQVQKYAKDCNRSDDLKVIELGGSIFYNPLDKPDLNAIVLANRLKTILTLFSPNNSESYWLDKAETVLAECIKLCRLYNNGYVTFVELHKLVNSEDYYKEKLCYLRKLFQSGSLSDNNIYNLYSAINFFETEFKSLDSRVLSILKSEISRITTTFISDYDILHTFSPDRNNLNFTGFKEVIEDGKIVVLNMNIAKYKNLSKIIATYLKLDFQAEVLSRLSSNNPKPCAFISDEFHEYVTSTDSDFFSQSREAKCVNIVATQSYTSLLNSLKDQSTVKVIVQNLINKLWFRTDDIFTIEDAQKQIGKEDKEKISRTISENAQETNFNYFTNSLNSKNSNVSESISTNINFDFIYDTNFFTQKLETFSCLAFLSNGFKVMPPQEIKMKPFFEETKRNFQKSKYKII